MAVAQKNKEVKDTHGTVYELTSKLGQGGQGQVFTTNHHNLIVKITNPIDSDVKRHQEFAKIQWVVRRPIRDLNIALPIAVLKLKNRVGYVMELMDNLESLTQQIKRIQDGSINVSMRDAYRDTGGLARRIKLLIQLAQTLAQLHGKGLCYGDLSPDNIYVSTSYDHNEVWLIDADNIKTQESSHAASYYTPGYGAPEVLRNESENSSWTDCWAFAVIAQQLLAHNHPYNEGIGVEDAYDDEDSDVVDEQVEQGAYAWIFDPEDDSNEHNGAGMPLNELINDDLFELFKRCFADSRLRSGLYLRPSMNEWHHELNKTLQILMYCQHQPCQGEHFQSSFVANNDRQCFFCGESNEPYSLSISQFFYTTEQIDDTSSQDIDCHNTSIISLNYDKYLYTEPYSRFDLTKLSPWCELKLTEDGLHITPKNNETITIIRLKDNKTVDIKKTRLLKIAIKRNDFYALKISSSSSSTDNTSYFFWRFIW